MAEVPFEDVPGSKVRPVVILDRRKMLVICLKMTSHAPRAGEYALQRWEAAGLRKPTTVRMGKLLRLEQEKLRKRLGVLHPADIIEIEARLLGGR